VKDAQAKHEEKLFSYSKMQIFCDQIFFVSAIHHHPTEMEKNPVDRKRV